MLPVDKIRAVYPAIGDAGFRALVDNFYRRVEADPELRSVFPPDLAAGRERQYLFLRQVFGGPEAYSEQHGHPRLRMRHIPFAITRAARDAWLGHMLAAITESEIPEPHASVLRDYFERFSLDMINTPRPEPPAILQHAADPARATKRLDVVDPDVETKRLDVVEP
jgi:hemoglobin